MIWQFYIKLNDTGSHYSWYAINNNYKGIVIQSFNGFKTIIEAKINIEEFTNSIENFTFTIMDK